MRHFTHTLSVQSLVVRVCVCALWLVEKLMASRQNYPWASWPVTPSRFELRPWESLHAKL